jgi:hypothetical protein
MNQKAVKYFIIGTFVTLYAIVSLISTIHVIDFFKLSNPDWLAVSLAIAFEIGAAASLASIIALKKMNKTLIWGLFIVLTLMQMMGNTYYAFKNLEDYQAWVDLFGLTDSEPIFQKRVLSIISGAVLPLVALGFIKSLVDYIKPNEDKEEPTDTYKEPLNENKEVEKRVWDKVNELREEGKLPTPTAEDIADEPSALAFTPYETEELEEEGSTQSEVDPELLDALQKTGELTQKDIDNYKEKSRIPERGKGKSFMNPQVMPGVNM